MRVGTGATNGTWTTCRGKSTLGSREPALTQLDDEVRRSSFAEPLNESIGKGGEGETIGILMEDEREGQRSVEVELALFPSPSLFLSSFASTSWSVPEASHVAYRENRRATYILDP